MIRLFEAFDLERCLSIIELAVRAECFVDHGDDEPTIVAWMKRAQEDLLTASVDGHTVVACGDGFGAVVLGVGGMVKNFITLNYVHPAAKGFGYSRQMMDHLESYAKETLDLDYVELISTAAARHFYRKRGYKSRGAPMQGNGVSWNYPMYKVLTLDGVTRCPIHKVDDRWCECRDYDG